MRRLFTTSLLLALLSVGSADAQNTAQQLTIKRDTVPITTIIPVQQSAYTVNDTITRPAPTAPSSEKYLSHRERRAQRARQYAMSIDSLIATRSFAFYPTAMQAVPDGEIRLVYADYFYIYVSPVDLEVHLPIESGIAQQMSILNFDTEHIGNYTAVKYLTQWNISFLAKDEGQEYQFSLDVSTVTGRTELTVSTPRGAMMQYVGSIGKRIRER